MVDFPDFSSADRLMHQAVTENVFPGAVVLLQQAETVLFHRAYGVASLETNHPVTTSTLFDLASLTKPLATTLSILLLVQSGQLGLSEPLGTLLPAFRGTSKEKVTPSHLLYHTAGLPAHRPYYEFLASLPPHRRKEALNDRLVKEPQIHELGTVCEYSDIGFMILRWIVETISGQRLDQFSMANLYTPLGIQDLFFMDLNENSPQGDFAATEKCPWRERLLEGVVSDENAYAVGGIDGHAGLFGTASAVARLMTELMSTYLGRSTHGLFQKSWLDIFFTRDAFSGRALGFDTPTAGTSSSGAFFSPNSIGHLGFTGTSVWTDLERDITVVLLTNRVHPSRDNVFIREFRPRIHDALMVPLI